MQSDCMLNVKLTWWLVTFSYPPYHFHQCHRHHLMCRFVLFPLQRFHSLDSDRNLYKTFWQTCMNIFQFHICWTCNYSAPVAQVHWAGFPLPRQTSLNWFMLRHYQLVHLDRNPLILRQVWWVPLHLLAMDWGWGINSHMDDHKPCPW